MNAPTYDGRQVMTDVVRQPRVGAENFGAQDMANLGGIAQETIGIDTQHRQELTIAKVRDATNRFRQAYEAHALDVMANTPVSDAADRAAKLSEERSQMVEAAGQGLEGEGKLLFDEHVGKYATEYAIQADQWVKGSVQKYKAQTEQADLDKTLQDFVANPSDEESRLHARGLIAQQWGDKDPAVADTILKAKTTSAAEAYISNLSVSDPIMARDALMKLKGNVDDNKFNEMFAKVNNAATKFQADGALSHITSVTTSTKDAINMANAIKDPAVRDATLAGLPDKIDQENTKKLALDGNQFKGWVDKIAKDPTAKLDPMLNDSDKAALEGYRHDLLSNRNKQNTENDKQILGNLLLLKATNVKALSEVDLASLQPMMSTEGFAKAVQEITDARQGGKPLNPEEQTMFDELKSQGKGELVDANGNFITKTLGIDQSQLETQFNANGRQAVSYLRDKLYSMPQNQRTPEAIKAMVADAMKPAMAFTADGAKVIKNYQIPSLNKSGEEAPTFRASRTWWQDEVLPKGTKYKDGSFFVPKDGTYRKLNASTHQFEKGSDGREVKYDRSQMPKFL